MIMTQTLLSRQEWTTRYANIILKQYQRWQSPLGIDQNYLEDLKQQLSPFYDDPLKKSLIETTYP